MESQVVHVGIVGMGGAGANIHGRFLKNSEKFKIVAVCDSQTEKVAAASEQLSCRGYKSYGDFLDDRNVQLVVIATPNHLHGSMAVEALVHEKNVIVEKPMCISVAEADQMIRISKENNLLLTTHQNRRWDGDLLAIRKAIEEGLIGKPILIQSRWVAGPYPKQWASKKEFTGGGAFLSYGPHLIDQVLTMAPSGPVSIFGVVRSVMGENDYFNSFLMFEDGLTAQIEMSRGSRLVTLPRWYVLGEKGDIAMPHPNSDDARTPITLRTADGKESTLPNLGNRWHEFYENVYEALNYGADLLVKPEDGRRYVAIAEAIEKSSIHRKVIRVK